VSCIRAAKHPTPATARERAEPMQKRLKVDIKEERERERERRARHVVGALDKSIGGEDARNQICAANRDSSPIVHRCRVGGLFIGAGR
jgi:hypothetical protein